MRVTQFSWSENAGWAAPSGNGADSDLVFFFGNRQALACGARYHELRTKFPHAHIVGCSTGGQIHNDDVTDDEIAAVALNFDATKLRVVCEPASAAERSRASSPLWYVAPVSSVLPNVYVETISSLLPRSIELAYPFALSKAA